MAVVSTIITDRKTHEGTRATMRDCRIGLWVMGLTLLLSMMAPSCQRRSSSGSGGQREAVWNSSVENIVLPESPVGSIEISFLLKDLESDELDVRVEYSVDEGVRWERASISGNSLQSLASSPQGITHRLTWESLEDLGFRESVTPILRITPYLGQQVGSGHSIQLRPIDNLPFFVDNIEHYFIHYGDFDPATIRLAETYDLVMLHPAIGDMSRETIQDIQDGVDPENPGDDVLVLAYISIGEDLRTVALSDEEMLLDPRFVGDGQGPRVDPRGPDADGTSLMGIDPLGIPSNGGTGYASFYLDDNSVDQDPGNVGDGKPDRNAFFGGCFVNAGDPRWFQALDRMTIDGEDRVPGIRELLTSDYGRSYGCDGLFLDTVDTCAPNSFTNDSSGNQSEFEWTAPGFTTFIQTLRQEYPRTLILQNRGLFFFDPRHPHFEVNARSSIDFLKFESYRLNSNTFEEFDPYFFADNKFNIVPKLMAEANRPDGFRVFSLGYAEGPTDAMNPQTLVGGSDLGTDSLLEDIRETQDLAGFRHFLTNAAVALPNDFVRQSSSLADEEPPVWTSTYNTNSRPFPEPPEAPDPRVGLQRLDGGPGCLSLAFDTALDKNPVRYRAYVSVDPIEFDEAGNPQGGLDAQLLHPQMGSGYASGVGPGVHAHEATLDGLACFETYFVCVRAIDSQGNEEKNEVVLEATTRGMASIAIDGDFVDWDQVPLHHLDAADVPDSSGPDWLEVALTNDTENLFVRYTSENLFNIDGSPGFAFSRTLVFIDIDNDPSTGYPISSTVGSELLVAGNSLFAQTQTEFNAGYLQELAMQPQVNVLQCEFAIPWIQIDSKVPDAQILRLLFLNDEVSDRTPDTHFIEYRRILP